jgi:hypothetical protein
MSETTILLGGEADGMRAPLDLGSVRVPSSVRPSSIVRRRFEESAEPPAPSWGETLYWRQRYVFPFDPAGQVEGHVVAHESPAGQWWTVTVFVHPYRHDELTRCFDRLNEAAERCGGWHVIVREDEAILKRVFGWQWLDFEQWRELTFARLRSVPIDTVKRPLGARSGSPAR